MVGEPFIDKTPLKLTLVLHRDAPGGTSILVSVDGNVARAVFLPRSQIVYVDSASPIPPGAKCDVHAKMIDVHLPKWLAEDRGLLVDRSGTDDLFAVQGRRR